LQVAHHQRGGQPLADDIGDAQAEFVAELQHVGVVGVLGDLGVLVPADHHRHRGEAL